MKDKDDKIVPLRAVAEVEKELTVEEVLEKGKEVGFDCVLVMGYDKKTNLLTYAAANMTNKDALWIMEQLKSVFMER